jgi:excisionase family DNA binding protein
MITKREAAELLGVSVRTLERNYRKWGLERFERPTPTGEATYFKRSEIERLRESREAAIFIPIKEKKALKPRAQAPSEDLQARQSIALIEMSRVLARPFLQYKMTLTVREAAVLSGLSIKHLRAAIGQGMLEAVKLPAVRGLRIHRLQLDAYVRAQFKLLNNEAEGGGYFQIAKRR